MKDIETLIYDRLTNDATLVSLIGDVSRIYHGFQDIVPHKPQLVYWNVTSTKGNLAANEAQVYESFYQFAIYADNYLDILFRLRRLFDNQVLEPLGSFEQLDCVFSHWDQDLSDDYDDNLEVKRKDCRIRFTAKLKPLDPI